MSRKLQFTNIPIVSFRDYNCIGPIGKISLSPGCSSNPLIYETCMGYTQYFCETPSMFTSYPIVPLFPPSSKPALVTRSLHSTLPTRNLRAAPYQIMWLFISHYANNSSAECGSLLFAEGYPIGSCVHESNYSFYWESQESPYITKHICVGSTCGMFSRALFIYHS